MTDNSNLTEKITTKETLGIVIVCLIVARPFAENGLDTIIGGLFLSLPAYMIFSFIKARKVRSKDKNHETTKLGKIKRLLKNTFLVMLILFFAVTIKVIKSTDFENASYSGAHVSSGTSHKTNDKVAYYMCKKFIKDRLNDPSSLDFPDSTTAHITSNGPTYDIAGTFRANNAFGAKVQSSYACTVTENPSKGTWTLDYLSEL